MKEGFSREQKTTIIYGILCFVMLIVVLQVWLLVATMNAYLGGDDSVALPAGLVSLALFGLNLGLLRYIRRD